MAEETGISLTNSSTNYNASNLVSHSNQTSLSSTNDVDSINAVFGPVPTRAEVEDSIAAFQSFMNNEGPRMLVQNPEFQPVQTAFHFMRTPMVQEMVGSVMCDVGVISAMLRNEEVQGFLRALMLGNNSTIRVATGASSVEPMASPQFQGFEFQGSDTLISMILKWLLDNMESGFMGIFDTLRSFVNKYFESTQSENTKEGTSSGHRFIYMTLLLAIINLLIVFVRRALKHKFKI